jgi:hypothetical protein
MSDDADITIDDGMFTGVWSNHILIGSDRDEFVLDFAWIDRREQRGTVVARVVVAPRLMRRLLDDGEMAWQTWSEENLPPEVRRDDG